jgi:predicted permease
MRAHMRRAIVRLLSLFRHQSDDHELRAELDAHLALREADLIRGGASPDAAKRQARLELGSVGALRDAHRDHRGLPWADALGRDVKAALRSLRRDAHLTASSLVIMGLGIGACAIVFSVVNTLLIRPLPFADADRLVWIANGESDNLSEQTTQVSNLIDLRARSRALASVAGFSPFYGVGDVRVTDAGSTERVTEVPVTEGFFPLLGVQPQLGRLFAPDECLGNPPKVVLLSHAFWQRRLAGDPAIVGRAIRLDDVSATVVGVLPEPFDFAAVFAPGSRADLFSPFPLTPDSDKRGNTLALVGRLADGASPGMAASEAVTIAADLPSGRISEDRWRNQLTPRVFPLKTQVSGSFRYALTVLVAAVALLLVLVCVNISGLLLAKGATRRREMAVRAALGAGRAQLVRQLLVESTLLAGAGAVLAVGVAFAGIRGLAGLQGTAVPLLQDVRLDATTLVCLAAIATIAGLATGLFPALQVSATSPYEVLTDGTRGSTSRAGRLRRALVVVEVALVCVMLTSAGLLTRSLLKVLDVQPGFDPHGLTTVRVDPGPAYRKGIRRGPYFDDLVAAVRAVPTVESAGVTDALPFGNNFGWRRWNAKATDRPAANVESLVRMVDAGYFATMRIAIVAGRPFAEADDATAEPLVILNEALARALWPGADPLGRTINAGGTVRRVVGVVGEARYFSLERRSGPEMYMPIRQTGDFRVVNLVVRSATPAADLAPALRAAVARVDPSVPVADVRSFGQLIDHTTFPRRSVAMMVLSFAVFGVVLATLGLYAVIAYSVHQRRQEIGIRMALGASPGRMQAGVLSDTLQLAGIGVAIGIPASWLATRAIRGLLFGIDPVDPVTAIAVLAVLIAVAMLAGAVPARRASRVDAIHALRSS